MYVSLNWLKQYVDIGDETPESLAEKITKTGIEVEGVTYVGAPLTDVVVGHVTSCVKHPDADKLNVTQVDLGDEVVQIVCGAKNVKVGACVAVAKVGAQLPGGIKIKRVKLRGVESKGMICSLSELGVKEAYIPKDQTEGIFIFEEPLPAGTSVSKHLNLDDAILELSLTPNRADAMSMLGVAYEVGAILNKDVHFPLETYHETDEAASEIISVEVEDSEDTPFYGAYVAKNITVKKSPLFMQQYLLAAGIRPVNNVVDITNYVLLEYGQPLHAFDLDQLKTNKIVVKKARENETFMTLDHVSRHLSATDLVVTDGKVPHALAGVMGGFDSEVKDETKSILLEAAYFSGKRVRQTAKTHGLRSEASARFEKGLDPSRVTLAAMRALHLLEKYAGATICRGVSKVDTLNYCEEMIVVNTERINKRLGTDLTSLDIEDILKKLKFSYEREDELFTVLVPTRRQDIKIFEDLLEEVARIYGYDNLPYTLPTGGAFVGRLTDEQGKKRDIKLLMAGCGFNEAVTYSLTSKEKVKDLIAPDIYALAPVPVPLALPMSEEHAVLRLSLLPELLTAVSYNQARKVNDVALFEMGSVFVSKADDLKQPDERSRLSAVLSGDFLNHPVQKEHKPVDFYVIKGIVELLLERYELTATYRPINIAGMHPGQTAEILVDEQSIGFVGQVHPEIASAYQTKATFVFDLDLEYVLKHAKTAASFMKIARFPSMSRDLAMVIDQDVLSHDILKIIKETAGENLNTVKVFDVYVGDKLPTGKKSLAFNLQYLNKERTLTDEEIEASMACVKQALKTSFTVEFRS